MSFMRSEEVKIQEILNQIDADPDLADHPLAKEFRWLAGRYFRLGRQLNKVIRIGDQLQGELRSMNEALEKAALTDALTGLPNRRAMNERLQAEAKQAERNGQTFAVIMGDIDRFKRVNDTYGHEVGDDVLRAVAATLPASLRGYDSCSRWGGEEFLILLPNTDQQGGLQTAERMRESIEALDIPMEDGTKIPVTISLGLALGHGPADLDHALIQADEALYEAKKAGRNRVACAP